MQVDGFTQVLMLALQYSRTITHVENMTAQHEHNTTAYVMILNRRAESFTVDTHMSIFKYLRILSMLIQNSRLALTSALLVSFNLHLSSILQ